ncbi:MAG: serine protease [Pirellulales bacterium]|nr:serine protease [Thermoguttaceae bacterium]MDD4788611.1 serine protease [Pirellulales bacterium]NLZ01147.1 trypsin-like peptidase domain-containing protein [Pirellulaceae bacterium]
MNRTLPLIVLVGIAIPAAAGPAPAGALWGSRASSQPHPAVVRVIVPEGEAMSLGSGSLVAANERLGLVVTNWHVVRDARGPITVVFPDGFRSGASILATDRDWDLAALAIWRPPATPLRLAAHAPQPGETLTIAGYGSGKYRAVSGRCVQYLSPGGNNPFELLEVAVAARDGDSGGPILNAQGELAGVLFGAARGRTAGSFCGRVQWFLASAAPRFNNLAMPPAETMLAENVSAPFAPPADGFPPPRDAPAWPPEEEPIPDWRPSAGQDELPSNVRPLPLASIPAAILDSPATRKPATRFSRDEWHVADGEAERAPIPYADGEAEPAGEETPIRWNDLVGRTRREQIKNILAALGGLAIVVHGLRIYGALQGKKKTTRRRRTTRRQYRIWY